MSKDVFRDIGFSEIEAKDLNRKSALLIRLQENLNNRKKTQAELAQLLGVDQAKVSKLLNGKIGEFSLERLMSFLDKVGEEVGFTFAHIKARTTKHRKKKNRRLIG